MDSVGTNGVRSNDLVELRKYEQKVKRHSIKDQPTDNLCKASSDDPGEKMVYLLQLLPTYLLHLTYGISLGALKDLCEHLVLTPFNAGFPSILVPQLSEQKNSSITLSPASEGLVVSLDYASTVLISFAAGQMQVRRCFSTTMMKTTLNPGKAWPNPSHSSSLSPNLLGLGQHRLRNKPAVHLYQVNTIICLYQLDNSVHTHQPVPCWSWQRHPSLLRLLGGDRLT